MQRTSDQCEQVESAKAAGERRATLEFTPEQRADWEASRDAALAEKDEVIASLNRMQAAETEETFSGRLRRAITVSRRNPEALANEIGIDPQTLAGFCCGDETLPSDVID